MSTRVLVAASRTSIREQVRAVLAEVEGVELVDIVTDPAEVVAALDHVQDVDVVLVDERVGDRDGLEVAREVGLARPLCAVVLMTQHPTPDLLSAAMDAGARSIVSAPPSLEEVRSRIDAAATWSRAARRHVVADSVAAGRAGRVVAVAGAKGGVGTTLVSLLVARSRLATMSVCLVDLDLQAGDLAAYAGVQVRRSVVDLVEVADEITGRALDETTYDIGSGLRLLGAPADGELGEALSARVVRQIISALRYQYDLVVVDCGSRLDDATAVVIEIADRAVLVATPDVPALRAARRTTAMWERLAVRAPRDVDLVLNRVTKASEVQAALAPRLAGIGVTATIPAIGVALEAVMNTASVLSARIADLDRAVEAVAASVIEPVGPRPAAGGHGPGGSGRGGRRGSGDREAGQVAVESPVIIGIALMITLVAIQLVLFGVSHIFASNAASAAADAYAVGMSDAQVRQVVDDALPSGWDFGWTIERPTPGSVQVKVRTPSITPSVIPLAGSTAAILWEPR